MIVFVVSTISLLLAFLVLKEKRAAETAARRHRQAAERDPLTGLADRNKLVRFLESTLEKEGQVACLFVDLTGFKQVNDRLGHKVGDAVLCAFAAHLEGSIPAHSLAARVGGDEFCVVLSGLESEKDALETAEAIVRGPENILEITADQAAIACNIGIAFNANPSDTASVIMGHADQAMYEGKSRNRPITRFDDVLRAKIEARVDAHRDLRDAFENGAFHLVYQPKFSSRTLEMVGAEALMRWPDKLGPAGSPGVFIPLAEEIGLIGRLGEWALDTACTQIKRSNGIPIAVNVSGKQLIDPSFPRRIENRLIEKRIAPEMLELEITESVLVEHTKLASDALSQLRKIGVKISLDDFGTGFSSLSYLQTFEFDAIKIDRSFIRDLATSETRREIVRAIIALANGIGAQAIAEGVETKEQIGLLQLLGCHQIQGYALGVPAPAGRVFDTGSITTEEKDAGIASIKAAG